MPQAQRRTATAPYRDYGNDRHKLILRVLDRIERTCKEDNRDFRQAVGEYFTAWFKRKNPVPPPTLQRHSSCNTLASSVVSSDDKSKDEDSCSPSEWNIEGLCKDEVDEFFCWCFFEKYVHELKPWEHIELGKIYNILAERCGLVFPPGQGDCFESRRMTLEDVSPLHRPFLVYFVVMLAMAIGDVMLLMIGFRCFVTKSGLTYWYRQGTATQDNHLPLLFFHGVAPAGKTVYLPMVLMGLGGNQRPTFLFENPNVSWTLMSRFDALTEQQMVLGVQEAVEQHVKDNVPVILCGHSLGSAALTYLLRSPLQSRIGQFIVMEPNTILMTESDSIMNFLYSRNEQVAADGKNRTKIHAASSEIFTEQYVRRHLKFYNAELWMDDIPQDVPTLVCLAELDEVVSARNVRKEVEMHRSQIKHLSFIQWNQVGHAHCISDPSTWNEIHTFMLDHERGCKGEEYPC